MRCNNWRKDLDVAAAAACSSFSRISCAGFQAAMDRARRMTGSLVSKSYDHYELDVGRGSLLQDAFQIIFAIANTVGQLRNKIGCGLIAM